MHNNITLLLFIVRVPRLSPNSHSLLDSVHTPCHQIRYRQSLKRGSRVPSHCLFSSSQLIAGSQLMGRLGRHY
jgi:hypothetical protein